MYSLFIEGKKNGCIVYSLFVLNTHTRDTKKFTSQVHTTQDS